MFLRALFHGVGKTSEVDGPVIATLSSSMLDVPSESSEVNEMRTAASLSRPRCFFLLI